MTRLHGSASQAPPPAPAVGKAAASAVRDANTAFARAFVDELARAGVTDACLAPGSRSTPVALALADEDRIRLHVHVDERSAAFFALGAARATGRPTAVLTTSGTASANLHPAVLEAHHGRVPMLLCTADRPPELRDTGAGQTVDQRGLFGDAVRWFFDPGPPEDRDDAAAFWRGTTSRAIAETLGPPAGPVHLNLPFREPLVPTGAPLVDAPGRADGSPWTRVSRALRDPDEPTVARVVDMVRANPRGVLAIGWGGDVMPETALRFADAAGWPVLPDTLSNARVPATISMYDALLRSEQVAVRLRPDVVIRAGAPLTSKTAARWLGLGGRQVLLDPDGAWLDPQRGADDAVRCEPDLLLRAVADALAGHEPRREWVEEWRDLERRARVVVDDLLDGWEDPFEGRIARDLVAAAPEDAVVAVASSMPVRDVESFAAPRRGVSFLANRGVNGIDGFTSTVLGAAAVSDHPVLALMGDLCFLHDTNGLLGSVDRGVDAVLVVVDNDGGGIFSFLPQADRPDHFETLFGTPHGVDLAALTAVHGIPCIEVEKASALESAITDALRAGGVRVVLVRTNRADNVARHREVLATVAAAVE
jgi:2-succinyl-5-enolpyruvyl-6-hydroxy-3-cyclohexene-1-carboxylate synthase